MCYSTPISETKLIISKILIGFKLRKILRTYVNISFNGIKICQQNIAFTFL